MTARWRWMAALAMLAWGQAPLVAQQESVRPGINDSFRDPNVVEFTGRFEVESREVFARRAAIVEALELGSGQCVADIGAGTGLFTRLLAQAVGPQGRVAAVDIAPKFLEHIQATCREAGLANVTTQLGTAQSASLPADSVDLVFICDTYHHFEFPQKMLASLHQALRPGGRLVLIDFRRIEGTSTEWILSHVRAGQEVFEGEIEAAGFRKQTEVTGLLDENYFSIFERVEPAEAAP